MAEDGATALLALWNDVDPAVEAAYEQWHAHEHVPERCTVPGILWGRRYRQTLETATPRYLTLYGLRDPQVLDSERYQRLLREPTPTSQQMRPALRRVSRWVCRLHSNTLPHSTEWMAVVPLETGSPLLAAAAQGPHLLAERIAEAGALPWLAAGQNLGIDGDWLLCMALDDGRRNDLSVSASGAVFERI
jgi:hypothetical protein